jgi:signal transduction histidine kinase
MRERAEKIGAKLNVGSSRDHGTTIEAIVPLGPAGRSRMSDPTASFQWPDSI